MIPFSIPFSGGSTTHLGILPASPADSPVVVTGSVLRTYPAPLILLPIDQAFAQLVPLQKMAEVEDAGLAVGRVRMPQSHEQGDRLGLVELFIPALENQLPAGLALLALVFQVGIRWSGPSALIRPPV